MALIIRKTKINWFERKFYKSETYCFFIRDWSHTDADMIFPLILIILQNAAFIINVILHIKIISFLTEPHKQFSFKTIILL